MNQTHADLLFELGTEELPPKSLTQLSHALRDGLCRQLTEAELSFGQVHAYASPRRLAVTITALQTQQASRVQVRRGPSLSAPEQAAQGFARSCGALLADLDVIDTDKGKYYQFTQPITGSSAKQLVPEMIISVLGQLPIAKRMRWGVSKDEFVRPVKWIVLMLGNDLLECEIFGIKNKNLSFGHRFHSTAPIAIANASSYAEQLRTQGHVIADFDTRREMIRAQVTEQANVIGANAVISDSLLNEVCGLVEWPEALRGQFDDQFLSLPAQVLVSSMAEHQKYFHIEDKDGRILPYFITVSNISSKDSSAIIQGNERVIRPRLADAAFFFETDKAKRLDSHLPALDAIVFQKQLGSLAAKSQRMAQLSRTIANQIGANPDKASRAAVLAKADLNTEMVLEFGDLQGLMGHVYALNDGEDATTAAAIEQHYWPKYAGDQLPISLEACSVAIADRIDTLTGLFGIKQPPTGSKDPYALRRAAVGFLRILIEHKLNIDLPSIIGQAYGLHANLSESLDATRDTLHAFIFERLRAYYEDKGVPAEVYLSVAANQPASPLDFDMRVNAVNHFLGLPKAADLAAANKRVRNILAKNPSGGSVLNEKLLFDAEEQTLYQVLSALTASNTAALEAGDYVAILNSLSSLAEPLEAFFANTMVIVEDVTVRNNRLTLLALAQMELGKVADISELVPAQ